MIKSLLIINDVVNMQRVAKMQQYCFNALFVADIKPLTENESTCGLSFVAKMQRKDPGAFFYFAILMAIDNILSNKFFESLENTAFSK